MSSIKIFLLLLLLSTFSLHAVDYTKKREVKLFIDVMHKKFNYKKAYLHKLFKSVRKNSRVPRKKTKKVTKPVKKVVRPQGSWDIYSRLRMDYNQTDMGVVFMKEHASTLQKAYEEYGVPPEYITAVIGIESYYGKNRGRFYVFDSLSHLAFGKHKRKNFYKKELQEFLRMCYREQIEPRNIKGSSSGAIGMAQFMPSNYKHFGVDFDNDNKIQISTPVDAIGSIANYFKKNGWKKDEPVGTRVSYKGNRFYGLKTGYQHKYHRRNLIDIYPRSSFDYDKKVMLIKLEREDYDELWYGAKNFYVITRYNHSSYYAMSVHQLAQKIKLTYQAKYQVKADENLYAENFITTY